MAWLAPTSLKMQLTSIMNNSTLKNISITISCRLFLITANKDFLHDMQFTLFGFLLGRGVHAICKSYGDEDNPRGHVFFVDQKDELADIANDEEIEFFRKFLQK